MKKIPPQEKDVLRIGSSSIQLQFRYFQGKSDGYIIFYVPSLKVTGYGNSEEEALKSLEVNLEAFCEDDYDMKPKERKKYLIEL
jgi:mannose/fructose/N-acetylgalactosamine-specific phosphotransferase system component IID